AGRVIAAPVLIEARRRVFFDVGQDQHTPGPPAAAAGPHVGRKKLVRIVKIVRGDAELLEIVLALRPRGRLAHFLHGGNQQGDQYGDDGDHDKQFNQRKPTAHGFGSRLQATSRNGKIELVGLVFLDLDDLDTVDV